MSSTYFLDNGTPHGSVLSPLLVNIMINDVPESSNGFKLALFADDSSMWKSGPNLPSLSRDVERYLTETATFFEDWSFKISVNNTVAILFSRSKHIPTCHPEDQRCHDQVREDGEVPLRHLRPRPHMGITHRLHHRPNLVRAISGSTWGASRGILHIV